jgi:hypothetical protein
LPPGSKGGDGGLWRDILQDSAANTCAAISKLRGMLGQFEGVLAAKLREVTLD